MREQVKSKDRVVSHGEVFTNEREVNAMLDLVGHEADRIDSRFFEPACGDGNFLTEILRRKLAVVKRRYGRNSREYEKYVFVAVTSIYGVELLSDNTRECRMRLYNIVNEEHSKVCKNDSDPRFMKAIQHVLEKNILNGDALTLKDSQGKPIIFSEWSMVTGDKVKRRDYRLDELLEGNPQNGQMTLYGESGSSLEEWEYDTETQTYIPAPIKEYPLTIFYEVMQDD